MTWFASHIYAEPTPAVISMLSAHPVLAKGLYLLNGKLYHKWPTEWQGRSKVRHGWPRNGILVAREICNPDTSKSPQSMKGHEAPWHHDAAISWTEISGSNGGMLFFLQNYLFELETRW